MDAVKCANRGTAHTVGTCEEAKTGKTHREIIGEVYLKAMQIKSSARSEGVYKMGSCAAFYKPDTGVSTQAVVIRTVEDVCRHQ